MTTKNEVLLGYKMKIFSWRKWKFGGETFPEKDMSDFMAIEGETPFPSRKNIVAPLHGQKNYLLWLGESVSSSKKQIIGPTAY